MKKNKKILIIALIYFAAYGFFNPIQLFSQQSTKFIFYSLMTLAIAFAFTKGISLRNYSFPKITYKLLIIGILISTVMGSAFHEQSYSVSLIATLPYFFSYMFFYVLMKLQPDKKSLEAFLKILVICSALIYVINILSFPNMLFGGLKDEFDDSRGLYRIGVPMLEIVITYFFYSINQWLLTSKKHWIFWISLTYVLIVLSLTRQHIFISGIFGILFILRSASIYKKILACIIAVFILFMIVPRIPIFNTLIELSKDQISANKYEKDDIRITAWEYYTIDAQANSITPIFGNGIPSIGNSKWGNDYEQKVFYSYGGNGCFTVDVGWAGFFWYFGGITTFCLLFFLVKAVKRKKPLASSYLTYTMLFIILTAITSGPILYSTSICSICLILYLIYGNPIYGKAK